MNEIPKDREVTSLAPVMQTSIRAFLTAANAALAKQGMRVQVGETRRTRARQAYLYSCNTPKRWVTNCDGTRSVSMHQYGIAVDLVIVNRLGAAVWDARTWRTLYALVPPARYGLELIPQELVHVQLLGSQAHVANGRLNQSYVAKLGLKLT